MPVYERTWLMANIFGKIFDWNGIDVTPTTPETRVDLNSTGRGGAGGGATVDGNGIAIGGAGLSSGYVTTTGGASTTTYTLGAASWSNVFTASSSWSTNVSEDLVINRPGKPPLKVAETLEAIMKRLAIIQEDFEKLEKYPALKEAYDNYKLIEALCHEEDEK